MQRDVYSNFKFFQALHPQDLSDADLTGDDIDLQGYEGCAIVVNFGLLSEVTSASYIQLVLQHTDASALGNGPSDYEFVSATDLIGLASTVTSLTSGVWKKLMPITTSTIATYGSECYSIGYRGTKRYVRLYVDAVGAAASAAAASDVAVGAIAILGLPADWPVNEEQDLRDSA